MDTPAETLDAEVTLAAPGAEGAVVADIRATDLRAGDRLGRHVILGRLGGGGIGVVYVAYDPQLDRKVAIKLLRGPAGATDPLTLQREAQAMARLQHPNVVTVYDVGEHGGRVYVAMELVEGVTLREWLKAEPRGWRDVLEMFLPAGWGLFAAHQRGLVHRDFKPDNVMVSDDGRVLVMDFGLARASPDSSSRDEPTEAPLRSASFEAPTAGPAGTPQYMAPEQFEAGEPSPAVDQFAFCVSLWEGVCGERPFEGRSPAELYASASQGRIRTPPAGVSMPGWLRTALQRGVSSDPGARWPSMSALLDLLEQKRRARWRSWFAAGLVVAAAVGGTWGWQHRREREQQEAVAACEAEGAVIDEVWNEDARTRVRAGMLGTGARFAAHSLETMEPWLDDYRRAWNEGRTQACVHATIDRDWDEELLDRSSWCFEDRKLQLEATVDQLSHLDRASARRAVRLASYLDPVSACLDPKLLQRLPAPPLEMREEIRAIRAELSAADRLRHAGRYDEALDAARLAREHAEALEWPPLTALARFIEGRCMYEAGRAEQADVTLVRAYFEAQHAGSWEVAFRTARSLVLVNSGLSRYREAEIWSRHANVLSASLEDPRGLDTAEGHYLSSRVYEGLGDYDSAAKEGEKAVALRTEVLGADHPITAAAARNLAFVYLEQGRLEEALALFEPARAVWEDAVGYEHPYIADLAMGCGAAHLGLGNIERALALFEEGIAIYERTVGRDHPRMSASLDRYTHALELLQARRGPDDPDLAAARERVAAIHRRLAQP